MNCCCCCCCCSIHPPEWRAGNGKLEIASRPLSPVTQRDLIRGGELAMPSPILHTPVVVHTNSSADAINVPRPACDTDQIHGQCCSALLTAISYVDLASACFCLYPLPLPPFCSVLRLRVQANVELHLVSSSRGEARRVKISERRHLSDSPQSVKGPCDGGLLLLGRMFGHIPKPTSVCLALKTDAMPQRSILVLVATSAPI
ncbi:hypothetical protein TsFJ059_000709 [Trichoderma semiorbis]|uniref:Uncharacterized protein n=1 Tax=Trichoderma semiorbis TaxID=1491008 RepID=A0A9P8KZ51_9HYPO|nr:hypothetical protein TsFJ059_000709 [Trichoderma semiorbis]